MLADARRWRRAPRAMISCNAACAYVLSPESPPRSVARRSNSPMARLTCRIRPATAIGIVGSERVGTIGLQECDRRAASAVRRSRAAEFGREQAVLKITGVVPAGWASRKFSGGRSFSL
jgi:hypothetical protein